MFLADGIPDIGRCVGRPGSLGGVGLCLGALGLVAGCPTVDLGDTPDRHGQCNPAGGLTYFQDRSGPSTSSATTP